MTTACMFVERGDEQIELVVEGIATPEVPDRTWGHPDSWYEGSAAWAEVHAVYVDDGKGTKWDGALTDAEERDAERRLIEALDEEEMPRRRSWR